MMTILLLFTMGIGQMWGETQAFTITGPTNGDVTQNNVRVQGSIQNKTFNGQSSTKVYKLDSSNPVTITSTTANVTKISFEACNNGTSLASSCKVTVSTDGSTYTTLNKGILVSGGTGTNSSATTGIYLEGYNSKSTVTIEFYDQPYRYIKIEKEGKETWVNVLNVYTQEAKTITWNNGGHGTAPTFPTSVERLVLPKLMCSGYKINGWKANVSTKVSGVSKDANTLLAPNSLVQLLGATTFTAQWEEVECAGAGEQIFNLSMNNVSTKKALIAGEEVDLSAYATITAGDAYFSNTGTAKGEITNASPGKLKYNDNAVFTRIELYCALQTGDVLSFTGDTDPISITTSPTRSDTYKTTSGSLELPAAFNGAQVVYIWRGGSNQTDVTTVSFSRPAVAETYTITLNPAGGSIDPVPSGWTLTAGQYVKSGIEDGSSVALLALTRDGYKLNGWKDGENADYTSPVTVTSDLTLTAQWAQTYAVTYVPNNGVLPAETMTDNNAPYKAGDEVTLLANTFTAPENKEFDAWVVTPTAGGDPITVTAGKFTMPAAAVTVTATWKDACALAPTVSATTLGTTSYTTQVVNCAGISVLGSAGCTISEYGFVYGTATAPTISDNKKALEGDYIVAGTAFPATTLTGLAMNTKYYVRAYATNSYGTAYGDEISFTTLAPLGNVLVVASSAGQTSDAITALRDNGFVVTVSAPNDSRDYTGFDLVVLDESLDGSLAQTSTSEASTIKGANIPVLNLKAFFYTKTNRWNWGTPVNPSPLSETATLSTVYTNIASHPIFDGVTITAGAIDMVNPSKSGNNLQGVTTSTLVEGKRGYTLATSATGTTCIHELTPAQRGVSTAKYLLIALSNNIKDNYSDDAKKMIVNAAKYLIGNTPWTPVIAPTLSSSVPANSATDVAVEGNIVLTFSENVTVLDASKFTLSGGAGSLTTASISASGAAVTIPYAGLDNSTEYTLATAAGAVKNGSDVPNAALSNIVFTTEAACTKPEAPTSLVASDIAYTSATLSWDPSGAGANGYKIALIKKDDKSVILDWTDESTNSYSATGLTQGTEYTFKVKYKGDGITPGQCEFSNEVTVDFSTTAPSVADLVTIADDYTFTPSVSIPAGTLSADSKFFAAGTGDCDISGGKMRVKTNRALAFKVADGAKIKVTFTENGSRQIQLGTALSEGNYDTYGYSTKSPYTFNVVSTGGVVYLTAQTDQLYFSKLEITYPHTVTYDLNGGTGDPAPTQASKYVGETFTAHDGVTGITAPATKEFDKWVDQDAADVAAGTTYTMPAKNVTLTAQWRNETVKYSVTYDLDDYTSGVAPTETDKAEGDVFAIKAAPERESYDFLGWLCDIDAHTYQATNNYTMTAAPTTFTAQWQQFFTITYKDGSTTLGTEKVNVGDSPAGIADPTKELYSFVGWTLVQDGDVLVDPTTLDASTTVYAKWTAFDGCTYLAPETSGGDLTIGATVDLKGASFGGSVKVANLKSSGSIAYHENGLYFTGGDKDSIRVTLGNKMKAGTKITVRLQTSGIGNHGLKLQTLAKANVATLGWSDAAENAVGSFTYTVVADDGLDGTKAFLLERSGSVYLKYISVEDCAPEEFVVTYKDGSTTMGTEDVFKNNHPTATGIATRKNGYVFQGWSETDGGSVVDLDDITITADKNLYAVYSARVCATSGSIYKFEVATGKVNGNILPSAPASMALTTDNYLASLSGGELEASVTGNNNRLQYVDSKGISFPNGDGGTLTIKLECPLKENDEIRFINYASNGNGITLSDGVNTMTLNSNNSMDVQTLSVPEAWETEGSYELTMVRVSSKTPKITYFEIYRCPALEGVTVADLTVREGASITPVMTLTPSDALVTSQAWSILSGSDKISINATTGAVTGEAVGDAEIKVVLNEDPLMTATATVHVVETFAQQDVDESIVWDFSKAGVVADAFTGQVLANVDGVTLDASQFDARKLVGTAQNITSTYFQGTMLTFNATEAGRLSVRFTNGNANVRTLKVYVGDPEVEVAAWSYSNAATENKSIEVPAGKVTLRSYQGDAPNNVRIMNLEFLALAHQRTSGYAAGDLGTVCLEDATIIEGANLYEIAGLDQYGYMAFDQILSGELEAGKPYLFEVTNPSKISFYKPVGAAHSDDEIAVKGMIGTFTGTTLYQNVAQNYYYFSGRHIWRVNDFTVAIPIPAHRCYVDMDALKNAVASSPLPGRRRVTLGVNGKNAPTAIENAEAAEAPRKVMINGTLFILRGEKMYDATGRLVK